MARTTEEHLRWLKAISKSTDAVIVSSVGTLPSLPSLGALTGTDMKALAAVDRCWELYCYTGSKGVLSAVASLLAEMQVTMWAFARALIARSLDWGDIERLWPAVDLLLLRLLDERKR